MIHKYGNFKTRMGCLYSIINRKLYIHDATHTTKQTLALSPKDLPPVTKKYDTKIKLKVVIAEGCLIHVGFLILRLGHSKIENGMLYRASMSEPNVVWKKTEEPITTVQQVKIFKIGTIASRKSNHIHFVHKISVYCITAISALYWYRSYH